MAGKSDLEKKYINIQSNGNYALSRQAMTIAPAGNEKTVIKNNKDLPFKIYSINFDSKLENGLIEGISTARLLLEVGTFTTGTVLTAGTIGKQRQQNGVYTNVKGDDLEFYEDGLTNTATFNLLTNQLGYNASGINTNLSGAVNIFREYEAPVVIPPLGAIAIDVLNLAVATGGINVSADITLLGYYDTEDKNF